LYFKRFVKEFYPLILTNRFTKVNSFALRAKISDATAVAAKPAAVAVTLAAIAGASDSTAGASAATAAGLEAIESA
jgi:hypothetical protein